MDQWGQDFHRAARDSAVLLRRWLQLSEVRPRQMKAPKLFSSRTSSAAKANARLPYCPAQRRATRYEGREFLRRGDVRTLNPWHNAAKRLVLANRSAPFYLPAQSGRGTPTRGRLKFPDFVGRGAVWMGDPPV